MTFWEATVICGRRATANLGSVLRHLLGPLPQHVKMGLLSFLDDFVEAIFRDCIPPERSPKELRQFERLYDKSSRAWHLPPDPSLEVKLGDKRNYMSLETDSVELEVGHFCYEFVGLVNATTVLETGVWRGYSTCLLAAAVKQQRAGGRIYAIDPLCVPHLWDRNDLKYYITWIPKRCQDALDDVRHLTFDLLVIDSHHDYETTLWEVKHFEPLLRDGGYILLHDSLSFDGVGAVVFQLTENPRFEVITLDTPRGVVPPYRLSGLTVVRKIRSGKPTVEYDPRFAEFYRSDPVAGPFIRQDDGSG